MSVLEQLENLSNSQLIDCHTLYCERNHYEDQIFNNNDDFFNNFFANDVIKAVQAVCYGDYSYHHSFVQFNGQGNLDSTDNPEELISFIDLAAYIEDNISDFSEWIEEEEEEDETED